MTAAAVNAEDAVRARARDEGRRAAWIAACADVSARGLVALIGGPTWTPAVLAAIDPAVLEPRAARLIRREGRAPHEIIDVESRAIKALRAVLEDRARGLTASAGFALEVIQELGPLVPATGVPKVLARWGELARGLTAGPYALAEGVLAEVRDACRGGVPGRVLDLVEAAAALERVVGGPLTAAVHIARHQIEYGYRVADDLAQLESYVPRAEPQAAFEQLVAGGGPWALHFLGVGGVGKTTFLRHVSVVEARARGLTVARIDFDYLGPSYPGRDPGKLIEAIVEELRGRITDPQQVSWLSSITEQLAGIRTLATVQELAGDVGGHARWFEARELDEVLSLTGSLLASLGRPLLIFDTCEELMKLAQPGKPVPSVEATFRLIEALHERCPALRVIFAGRRLLAEAGAGWTARPSPLPRSLTAARGYLALHELRGFSAAEAEEALQRRLPAEKRGERELIDAILRRSPEDDRAAPIERPAAGPEATRSAADEPARFSPFRVTALASLVAAEPDVEAADLERGDGDPYIEHRIVRRMGPLEDLLPVVALLRELDEATLTAVLGLDEDAAATIAALADHEWIDVARDASRGIVLTAKPSVVRPLARYLEASRPDAWKEARDHVAAVLGPRLAAPDALRQPAAVIDGALRAMPEEAAVRAWQALEARIGSDWASALTLTDALIDEDGVADDLRSLLDAAVRATHASAMLHEQPDVSVGTLWRAVAACAQDALARQPAEDDAGEPVAGDGGQPPAAWLLLRRARLGAAAADACVGAEEPDPPAAVVDVLEELTRWRRLDALTCSVIAAVEAIVEGAERDRARAGARLGPLLAAWQPASGGAAAFVAMLQARLRALDGNRERARTEARRACELAQRDGGGALPATTLDWVPPASVRARVQLEALRLAFYDVSSADDAVLAPPADDAHDADSEHLRAAIGMYREARARTAAASLPVTLAAPPSSPHRAHARFPADACAIALRRDGRRPLSPEPDAALGRLWHRAVVERATFAMDPQWVGSLTQFDTVPAARAKAVADLERVPLAPLVTGRVDLVDAWSTQVLATLEHVDQELASVRPQLGALERRAAEGPLVTRMKAAAMLEEVVALSSYTADPLALEVPPLPDAGELAAVHPDDVEDVARLALRAWAAGRFAYPPSRAPSAIDDGRSRGIDRKGLAARDPSARSAIASWLHGVEQAVPRRFAQLAYEEAQLLALRLPERAVPLFELALLGSARCGDKIGEAAARLAADVARCRAGKAPVADARAVIDALEPADAGVLGMLATRLMRWKRAPAEGASKVDAFLAPFERRARRRPARTRRLRSWWRRHGEDVLVWAGVVGVIGVLIAGVVALNWWVLPAAAAWAQRSMGFGQGGQLATVASAGLVLLALFNIKKPFAWLRRRRRDRRVRDLAGDVRITRGGDREVAIAITHADGQVTALVAQVPRAGRHPEVVAARGRHDVPLPLTPLLDRLARLEPAANGAPLRLTVDPGLTGHAWERLLLGSHPLFADAFAPVRVIRVSRPPARAPVAPTLLASPALHAELGQPLDLLGVIQAIGRPVRGPYALGLDLGTSESEPRWSPAKLAPADARLVILQGAPQAATEVPTDAFRIEVGLLRELGAALIAHGVGEVLIVPPVPISTMKALQPVLAATHSLDRAFVTRPDHAALAHAVRRHLRAIEDSFHPAAALEVTLLVATAARGTSFGAIVSR